MELLAGRAGHLAAAQPHHHLSAPQIAPSVDSSPSCQQSAAGAPSPSSPPSPALPQRSDASPAPALSPTASVVPEGPAVNNVVAFSVHIPRTDEAPQALGGGGSSSSSGGRAVTAHSGTHQERIANTGGRSPSRRGASPCRRDAPPARAMTLEGPMVAATSGSLELLEQAGAAVRPQDLAGLWAKDPVASDVEGYERALDLWQISGAQKATARLIEGLEIAVHGNTFSVHFLTIIPMFKVTEAYDLARPVVMMRRGRFEEAYVLRDGGSTLEVTSTISVGTTSATTVQVYRRQAQGMKREHLLSASERRHGKPTDILRRFGMPSF
ncbi:hypothetical protein QJQ45_005947 [Haematococcus lacustris]|nr:hypothetical protein QJQ45_005947 [Haematococcus lacustris]